MFSTGPKSIKTLPKKPGRYNIEFEGVNTFLPLFATFDGEQWLFDGSSKMFVNMGYKCFYHQNDETPDDSPSP